MSRSTGGPRSASRPRSSDRARRLAHRLATAATLSVLVLPVALPTTAAPAMAAPIVATPPPPTPSSPPPGTDDTPALVALTGLSPLDVAAGEIVTFEGVVTNRSDQSLAVLNAYLRLSRVPLTGRADLAQLADPGFRPGARQASFVLATDLLAPGASASFSLDVLVADLRLVVPGVYAAGIEVLATNVDGSRGVVGRAMTALPWMPADAVTETVGVAVAWPVVAPVDRAADGTYLSDELGEALTPGGRLAAVLETAPDAPVTWLVDPAVVEAAVDLADGYDVRTDPLDPSTAQPGTRAGRAAEWLEQVRRLADGGRVTLMPYADVDAVALGRAGLGEDVLTALDSADTAAEALGLDRADNPRSVLRPPGGLVDLSTAERLAAAGVTTLLLDASNVATDGPATTVRLEVGAASLTAVLADGALQDLFSADPAVGGAGGSAGELAARQLLLAHTALAALAAPTGGSGGRTVLVVSGDEASTISPAAVIDALDQDVPWMDQVTLDAVSVGPIVNGQLAYPDEARAAELSGAYVSGVAALAQKAALRAALVSPAAAPAAPNDLEPTGLDQVTAGRLRLTSAAWRSEPVRAATTLADAIAAVDAELGQVRILDGGSVTLSSRTGRFPLTIVNDLAVPVTVQLTLASRTPARLRVPSVTGIEVAPGARTTVDVSAEANANGEYVVDAQLATTAGARFGPPSTLTIRATDYDTVAWIVMGAAGGLLLIGSVRRISRRVRASRRPSASPLVEP